MQRRHLFSRLSRLAFGLAWQTVFGAAAPAQVPEASDWQAAGDVFTLGVASGEPRPDSVVLWTRLAPQPLHTDGGMPDHPVRVQWELAADRRFNEPLRSGEFVAEPRAAHSVHVEVADLAPGGVYFYRFHAGGRTSPVGRTRTAPPPDQDVPRMRMAVASCQHYEAGYYTVHREIAASDVDLVVFLGDYIYETEVPPFARTRLHPHVFPDKESHYSLRDYRLHHASYKLDPDLRACHAAHPWLLVWDDHEVVNDYAGQRSPDLDDVQDFLRVRAAAYQAYFEHLPISPSRAPVGPSMAMHAHYQWGRLVDIWTVDGRQYRDGHVCDGLHAPMNGRALWQCAQAESRKRSMLGMDQEYWLAAGLASSAQAWKFIAQPTQMAPGGADTPWGPVLYADGWDAFPAARERLMWAIAQPRVPDVICLGGDVHRHVAANLRLNPRDRHSPVIASEFVTTSVSTRGLSECLSDLVRRSNPDLLHLRGDERGYLLMDVTPARVQCEFRATPHPVRADARLHTQARFVVDRGRAGPRRA